MATTNEFIRLIKTCGFIRNEDENISVVMLKRLLDVWTQLKALLKWL